MPGNYFGGSTIGSQYRGTSAAQPPSWNFVDRNPTTFDINYKIGDLWMNTAAGTPDDESVWVLISLDGDTTSAGPIARWIRWGGVGLDSLTGDVGTNPVLPDNNNNINIFGTAGEILVTGDAASNTLTLSIDGGLGYADQFTEDIGVAVPAAGNVNILGSRDITTTGAGSTVTIIPTWNNLGMTIDTVGRTITIHSADGTALSTTNPASITVRSKLNVGQQVTIQLTVNRSMDIDDMTNNTMGTAPTVIWDQEMPLYLYAVINDAEDDFQFAWGRVPNHGRSSIVANIGTPASATANNKTNYAMFIWEDVTIGDYDANPLVCIGSARATKSALDVWTFITMDFAKDGINEFNENTNFNFPANQNGADAVANAWFLSNGGTTPVFDVSGYNYQVQRNGTTVISIYSFKLLSIGVGANSMAMSIPLAAAATQGPGTWALGNCASLAVNQVIWKPFYFNVGYSGGWQACQFLRGGSQLMESNMCDTITAGFIDGIIGQAMYVAARNE